MTELPLHAIAVVEDDPQVLDALRTWLDSLDGFVGSLHTEFRSLMNVLQPTASGWQVSCPGLAQALPLAGAVLDLNLPGLGGNHIARQLRTHAPDLPVVIITAASLDPSGMGTNWPEGVVCLKKPFRLEDLETHLRLPHT